MAFSSGSVSVFPSTYRTLNLAGRYTSETNFTNILKAISDKDSFVVDFVGNDGIAQNDVGTLKFVIDGYYFEITNFSRSTYKNTTLYINVKNGYLVNFDDDTAILDDATGFLGLSTTSKSGSNIKSLKITDENGNIINKGFISALVDSDGNWFDFSKIFNIKIIDGKIDATSIDFSTLSTYTYLLNIIAGGATKLTDSTGSGLNVGTGGEKLIYFDGGVPKESNATVGTATKPVYLSGGKITASNATVGGKGLTSDGKGLTRTEMYLDSGTLTAGNTITIDSKEPGSSSGQNGDLWFVIG